jgi:hypothetical protein
MSNKKLLLNIYSEYSLKKIFSYVKYKDALKLIKYNKQLQSKLGISQQNYQTLTNYQYIKRKITRTYDPGENECIEMGKIFFTSIITFIFLIYVFIYSILLVSLESFDKKNTKINYDKNSLNIINKINAYLFLFIIFIIASFILLLFFILKNCYSDSPQKKRIKLFMLIVIDLIYFLYECLIIWKLSLSYKIKKNDTTWFMTCDYIFIILNSLFILYMLFLTYLYYIDAGKKIEIFTKYILIRYKNIEISNYLLPDNFHKMSKKAKNKFISDNKYNFQISLSKSQLDLISLINEFREKNNLEKLKIDWDKKLPNFILNETSELMMFPFNIIKLGRYKYLFKYNIGEFEVKFRQNEKDIINILLENNLNRIIIIYQNMNEFILVYESYKHYSIDPIELRESDEDNDEFLKVESLHNESYTDVYFEE